MRAYLRALALLGALPLFARPAAATPYIDSATGALTCTTYTISVTGQSFPGGLVTINYSLLFTPQSGSPFTIDGSMSTNTTSTSWDFSVSTTQPVGPLTTAYTVTGTATLVSGYEPTAYDTKAIAFTPDGVSCVEAAPAIKIVKFTNGVDADHPPGPTLPVGAAVEWSYVVTNPGNVPLANVTVTDSRGVVVACPKADLAPAETMTCSATGTAAAGQYENIGYVTGTPPVGPPVVDQNPSHYFGTGCAASGTTSGSIDSNFNGTAIKPGSYVWFNSNFKASGISQRTTIWFTGGQVRVNGIPHSVPDAVITFDPNASCASTMFDGTTWVTTVPLAGSDEVFMSGLALPFPGGLPGGADVTWSGQFASDQPGVTVSWKWGAAVYASFTTNYNSLGVKAAHTNTCSYSNSDHAGTPESYKASVVGGARGGGGSNWTGSWSATQSVPLCR